jgi:hypothetical protein
VSVLSPIVTKWYGRTDCEAQASGMVSVQAACSIDQALDLIDLRAEETKQTAENVAQAVVDHLVRFAPAT